MRAARVHAPGSSPSHLGPPKARIMSISWKPWASLGAPSPADAHDARACCAHHEVTAAGGSSIIEFAGAAPPRPKTCPNATRNACAFRSHSPANFEFPRPCQRPCRGAHHEHQRDPRDAAKEGRGAPLKASPLRLRQALVAHGARFLIVERLASFAFILRHSSAIAVDLTLEEPSASSANSLAQFLQAHQVPDALATNRHGKNLRFRIRLSRAGRPRPFFEGKTS